MRIQYAVVCHQFEDGNWFGVTNLLGVCHKLVAPALPGKGHKIPLQFVVSLIEGTPGWHRIWVTLRYPTLEVFTKIPTLDIQWDEESPTFFTIFDIPLEVKEEGIHEFTVIADGEPLGSVPLPVEAAAPPRG